jgi:cytoskeletal protein CcmA (bactofilin family)
MLRIDGQFSGHVDSVEGTLIVSHGAHIKQAVINVAVAKINGTVEGDINATREVVLGPTADVTGTVSTRLLTVAEGAIVNGTFVPDTSRDT